MLRGLWRLTWIEIKIFVREPLGVFGTVVVPVVLFVVIGRMVGPQLRRTPGLPRAVSVDLPILAVMFIAIGAVLSLVAIMAIYREGGILKRLRATPLRPHTILTAHVLVKLLFSVITVAAMLLAGRRYFPVEDGVPLLSFGMAVLLVTISILALGFVIASVVPTARFAQPVGALVVYPMLGLSGLFMPIEVLPAWLQVVARASPLTYAVSLLRGIWHGDGWVAHTGDVAVLLAVMALSAVASSRLFRWE